jgi:Fe-S-cluster containining protein
MPSDQAHDHDLFRCAQCGDCCKGYGGTYVSSEEIDAIAAFIGVKRQQFIAQYCELSGGRPLLAQASNGYCRFWDTICTIHPVKPRMCREWPFIASIVEDVVNWHIMAASCPGMRTDLPDDDIKNGVASILKARSEAGSKR